MSLAGPLKMEHRYGAARPRGNLRRGQLTAWLSRTYPYLFMIPAVVSFVVFILYPIVWVVVTSLFSQSLHGETYFAGFSNYAELIADPVFWNILRNMFLWALITIPAQMIIGGLIAYGIEEFLVRSQGFFRSLYFIPVVTSVAVISIIWSQLYAPYYGLLQQGFKNIGINFQTNMLGTPDTAIFALIIVNVWEWTGFSMLMYIPAIDSIPFEVFDSSRIDGASGLRLLWNIVVPMVSPVTKALLLLGIIGTLQTFPLVYLMTNGGPNHATEIFGTYIFKEGFALARIGYAAALSVSVLVLALVLTALQIRFLGSRFAFQKKESKG